MWVKLFMGTTVCRTGAKYNTYKFLSRRKGKLIHSKKQLHVTGCSNNYISNNNCMNKSMGSKTGSGTGV